MRSHPHGLTLVEVLIALVILLVGIFALAQLQASSLRSSALARSINETTRFARGELDRQRQTAITLTDVNGQNCMNPELLPEGIASCTLTIVPCHLAGASLVCGPGVNPSAFRISVDVVGPMSQELTLSGLWTGKYIAGAAGSISGVTTP